MVASKSVLNRGMFMLRIVHSHVEGGKSAHRQIYLLATLSTWCTSLMLSRPSRNEAFSPSACPGIHCLCKKTAEPEDLPDELEFWHAEPVALCGEPAFTTLKHSCASVYFLRAIVTW